MPIQTVFLDAGGVLVHPNWTRVSDTLRRHGVEVSAAMLAAAEPHAKRRLDTGDTIAVTTDQQRGTPLQPGAHRSRCAAERGNRGGAGRAPCVPSDVQPVGNGSG